MVNPNKAEQARRPLAYDDRVAIEHGLNRGDRVAWIARSIGRTQHMVSQEIKRNWTDDPRGHLTIQNRNICVKYAECEVRRLCKTMCAAPCRRCRDWLCNSLCPDFEAKPCPKLERTPFSCNSCPERQGFGCSHPYRFYEASYAQDLADARKSEVRSGIDCDPEAFEHAVEVIKDGLAKGQSPQHIIAANPEEIPFGMRSLYNYLGGAKMGSLTKIDLPKAVRYRPRAKSGDGGKSPQIPRAALEGRRWSDFQMLDAADRDNAVEMDTVVGRQGKDKQCILTMMVRRIGFRFYILLPDKSADSVIAAIDTFCDLYGERFGKVFGLVVCDRGTEFSNPERIERGRNGKQRLRLYYADPQQSQQKPKAERKHAELRRILPKGKTDFDALTGRDMAACMSHVNSYMVGSMGWASPMDLAEPVEAYKEIVADLRGRFESVVCEEAVPELADEEWIEKCSSPIGFDDQWVPFELEVNIEEYFEKLSELGWRNIVGSAIYVVSEWVCKMFTQIGVELDDDYDGALCWGYIDPKEGLSLRVLAPAGHKGEHIFSGDLIDGHLVVLRAGSVEECMCLNVKEENLEDCQNLIEIDSDYAPGKELAETREIREIDSRRHSWYPDDVQVVLGAEGMMSEWVWARLLRIGEGYLEAMLLNEPEQNFGVHVGDTLQLKILESSEGEFYLVTNPKGWMYF